MEQVYGTVTVKADLQAFLNAADQVQTLTNRLQLTFDEIRDMAADQTRFYWNGDAADRHRKGFSDQKDSMDELIRTLNQYPEDLRRISGNYDATIRKNVETVQTLNTDFVMV